MRADFLGDSFDIVKRFWADRLGTIAPLFAHPIFVPVEMRVEYQKITGVPILPGDRLSKDFGLFLDPDTGVPLPAATQRGASSSHATLSFIVEEFERLRPVYMICFDQSHNRGAGLSRSQQRDLKRAALQSNRIMSFYYISHAPFLFMSRDAAILESIRRVLVESGIPERRLECGEPADIVPHLRPTITHHVIGKSAQSPMSLLCPACGEKEFKHWPFGWDAHAAHTCKGLAGTDPEKRKIEFRNRYAAHFSR
jgi:hypothetical protein